MIDIRALPNLSIQQKDFVAEFYRLFNWDSPGSNHHIANVEPLLFEGATGGSEFLVYAATKLYLCFDVNISSNQPAGIIAPYTGYCDENNVSFIYTQNNSICYDSIAPAINYGTNNTIIKNLWFSRFVSTAFFYMKFIGYRITLD